MVNDPRSMIKEDGSCDSNYAEIIPDKDLISLLKMMIFNRVLDKRMLTLQRQGRLGFSLSSTGEEAVIYGSAYSLNPTDPIFLTYRELGVILWRGAPLNIIMNQFFGNNQDYNKGRQMPVHYCYKKYYIPSVSSPVGTQLPHACGYAYASKLQNTGQVSLAFLGEGTASCNDFHSALNFSGVFAVPAIFIIRNNGYAISTPETNQTAAESLSIRAEGYGMPGIQIDGNDLLMVVKTVKNAVKRAREKNGPTLIEALTYRLGAHSSSDDPTRYRPEKESEKWAKIGPLIRLTTHAKWRKIWKDSDYDKLVQDSEKQVSTAIKKSEKLPPPSIDSLFEDVYEAIPSHLKEQQLDYISYLKNQNNNKDNK